MEFRQEYQLANGEVLEIRKVKIADAQQTVAIWNSIVKEKKFTMGLNLMDIKEEKKFIKNLDKREAILVAIPKNKIVGYLILTIPDKICRSTLHVAEIGTFALKKYRQMGIGHFLLTAGVEFARINNFEKMIIKVRSSNKRALVFYQGHGFQKIGKFKKQIKIARKYEDHILMEKFL